jgi:hypothetical protein
MPDPKNPLNHGSREELEVRLALLTCCLIQLMLETGRRVVEIEDFHSLDSDQVIGFDYSLPGCRFYLVP